MNNEEEVKAAWRNGEPANVVRSYRGETFYWVDGRWIKNPTRQSR